MKQSLELQLPDESDSFELCTLINSAYRGKHGWTRETNIINGKRINIEDTKALINNPKSHLLIAKKNGNVIACACIEKNANEAYIGLLAVHSKHQNIGLGKKVLHLAENYAVNQLGINKFIMAVVSQRNELIEFYERRGYIRTGKIEKYPININVGVPKEKDLTIEYLSKNT